MNQIPYDAIVVGAGFSGSVVAEQFAKHGKRVLILEYRDHIGGNCYEKTDELTGVRIHLYGPHLFHTDDAIVFDYLSQFTSWRAYKHKVLAEVNDTLVPLPFSFLSIRQLFPSSTSESLIIDLKNAFPNRERVPILELRNSSVGSIRSLADFIYKNVFLNYSAKQWGLKPEDLNPEVTARVPVLLSTEEGYFPDQWQYMPIDGMNPVFTKLLSSPNIDVKLSTDYKDHLQLRNNQFYLDHTLFNGPIFFSAKLDELFDYCFGDLPYRSLKFSLSEPETDGLPAAVVNYPNRPLYTRISDCRQLSGQHDLPKTRLMTEFPQEYISNHPTKGIPYYPIFTENCQNTYQEYSKMASRIPNLVPLGRLAEYRYYDMDDAILRALNVVKPWLE